jgi:hypothetical protein
MVCNTGKLASLPGHLLGPVDPSLLQVLSLCYAACKALTPTLHANKGLAQPAPHKLHNATFNISAQLTCQSC